MPCRNGRRLVLHGEDKAALIEPIYQQCDSRLCVEALYDRVNVHDLNITNRDIKTYLYTKAPKRAGGVHTSGKAPSIVACKSLYHHDDQAKRQRT